MKTDNYKEDSIYVKSKITEFDTAFKVFISKSIEKSSVKQNALSDQNRIVLEQAHFCVNYAKGVIYSEELNDSRNKVSLLSKDSMLFVKIVFLKLKIGL